MSTLEVLKKSTMNRQNYTQSVKRIRTSGNKAREASMLLPRMRGKGTAGWLKPYRRDGNTLVRWTVGILGSLSRLRSVKIKPQERTLSVLKKRGKLHTLIEVPIVNT